MNAKETKVASMSHKWRVHVVVYVAAFVVFRVIWPSKDREEAKSVFKNISFPKTESRGIKVVIPYHM